MENEKIRVLIREPGKEARVEEIVDHWMVYGNLVGGLMENIPMPNMKNVLAVINESGKLEKLEPNIFLPEYDDMLVGTVVVVGKSMYGEFQSLTDEQIEKIKVYITANDASDFKGNIDDYNKVEIASFENEEDFFKALFGDGKQDSSEM